MKAPEYTDVGAERPEGWYPKTVQDVADLPPIDHLLMLRQRCYVSGRHGDEMVAIIGEEIGGPWAAVHLEKGWFRYFAG